MADQTQREIKAKAASAWKRLQNHVLTCPHECCYGNSMNRCTEAQGLGRVWHTWDSKTKG